MRTRLHPGIWIAALVWFVIAVAPFVVMVQTSFKAQFELLSNPILALPNAPTLENFAVVLNAGFFKYFRNSLIVVSISVILILMISAMAAFVFARTRFALNKTLFGVVVAGLVIPVHVTLVPVYLLTRTLGIYDTWLALIGPYVAFSLPLSIFILTEFMRQIPRELEDAARIDGCGLARSFFSIILPLSNPGLMTLAIYNTVFLWNEFVFAFVLTSSPEKRTMPLAIWEFQGQYAANIPGILAVVTLSSLPLIAVYIFGQERIIRGMMAGALKG